MSAKTISFVVQVKGHIEVNRCPKSSNHVNMITPNSKLGISLYLVLGPSWRMQ